MMELFICPMESIPYHHAIFIMIGFFVLNLEFLLRKILCTFLKRDFL